MVMPELRGGETDVEQVIATIQQEVKPVLKNAQQGLSTVQEDMSKQKGSLKKSVCMYHYLLIEIGTKQLKNVFDVMIDHDFANYLASHITEAQILADLISANKIPINQLQYLPPLDVKPDSSNFDITLLICLLRHVCGLKPPSDTVWTNPSPSDVSIEADITRLKKCKNQLKHRETVVISEAQFTVKWNELRQILLRLNNVGKILNLPSLIKEAEKMDIDEELTKHLYQTIKTWSSMEDLVDRGIEELQLSIKEDLQELTESLKEVRQLLNLSKRILESMDWTLHEHKPKQLDIDESNKKIFQIRSQLIESGTRFLQKHFHYRVGNDFAKYLAANEAEKTKVHWLIDTNRMNELQATTLLELCQTKPSSNDDKSEKSPLPPSDQPPTSFYMCEEKSDSDESCSSLKYTNFDISLLTVLLRYVCGLRAPNDKVWKEPLSEDMSIEADISRLGQCRNSIMKLKQLDKENIDKLWKELREILARLGRGVGCTDDLISSTGDADFDDGLNHLHMNMLDKWYANDQRDIRFEQEYAQRDFFNDSDDDAWTIDEENVSMLLSKGKLPNAKLLKRICEKFGSSSSTVRKVCAYICNTLQMTSEHIKRCWPAYIHDTKYKNDINVVTFVAVKDIEYKLEIEEKFGYNVYELFHGSNSAETSDMMERDIKNANKFNEEMDKIEECVSNHSFSLMQAHSNITLIAGSTVKSINYTTDKIIIEKPCVAIYVHKKGYIPLGENPFPTQLDDFDTDIRECVVSLFGNDKAYEKHDKLLMGTSIRNHCSTGTLGGFVEHTRYGLCGLTCAHVLCGGHLNGIAGVKHWSSSDQTIDVFQPANNDGDKIGKVVCAILSRLTAGMDNRVGIDIALVKIDTRRPDSGQFAIDTSAALTHEYNSGRVLNRNSIQRGAVCIKYGSETGRTESQVANRSCSFRINTYVLNKQLLVYNKPQPDHFAAEGDSGSLSFVEDDNGLHAIGVVVGGDLQWQTCCLTPLSDILDALSEDNTVQVTMKNFVVPGEPMQE